MLLDTPLKTKTLSFLRLQSGMTWEVTFQLFPENLLHF